VLKVGVQILFHVNHVHLAFNDACNNSNFGT